MILKGACRLGQNEQASLPTIRLVIMRIAAGELLALACSSKVLPGDASSNSKTAPVQLYHLGLWFDSPVDANKAGCGSKMTPLNSSHNAGVQILNTSNFPNLNGPLRGVTR